MDTKIKLRVQGLTNSQIQSGAYALILAEENGLRRIPIIVGTAEAQSIAIALEKITPPRPLTHDLFASFTTTLNIYLKEVLIYKFEDGVFYSELVFQGQEHEIRLDSRTSDAIAIALRLDSEIYTTESILRECGVVLEEIDSDDYNEDYDETSDDLHSLDPSDMENEEEIANWAARLDMKELKKRLDEAIKNENYELAKIFKEKLQNKENGEKEL